MQRLRDLMTTPVLTFQSWSPATDAWREMRARRVRHGVVVHHGGVSGVVSTRDLGGARGSGVRMGRSVGELMARDVVTASPEMSLARAAKIMCDRRIGCLPLVQRGKLVGIVTLVDLLAALTSGTAGGRAP